MPATKKRKGSAPLKPGEKLAVTISLDPSPDTPLFYVNTVEIGRTQHDFVLLAGRVPAKLSTDDIELVQSGGSLHLEPDVQLIMSATLVPRVIAALQAQLDSSKLEESND